jgi:hypothetical protein
MKRSPVTRQTREMDRRASLAVRQASAVIAVPTADAQAVNTVGHTRDTGCDTSGDFYVCGILGFTPLGSFILCSEA